MCRIVALVSLGVLPVLSLLQSRLIFPGQASQGCPTAEVRPGPGAELVEMTTEEGDQVVALFGPALTPDGRPRADRGDRPTVLFFYGNGDCMAGCASEFEMFRRLGANVLIPDYLGYGLSGGQPSERACYATADAAFAFLKNRPDVDPDRIIAAGWSLGGAVAVDLASRRPVAGLAVFCSFTRMGDMVRRFYPIPGLSMLLKHRFDSIEKIRHISCPTLIGHGSRDRLIPASMSDRLARAAGGPVTTFQVDSGHADFFLVGSDRVEAEMGRLIDQVASVGAIAR